MGPPAVRSRILAALAAVYILWGSTYLAVALGLQSVPPFLLMGLRSVAGGFILVGLSGFRHAALASGHAWRHAAIGGLLFFVGCHGALAYAQQKVPSGVAAIILATIPFWIVVLNFLVPMGARPRPVTLIGLLPGFAGVALIAWREASPDETPIDPTMIILLVGSAFSWAAGSFISQHNMHSVPTLPFSGMQLMCGGAVLLVLSALVGELSEFYPNKVSAVSLAGLAYLILAGTVIGFTAYVWLLDHVAGPLVATYTFVNPVIAVIMGWALLGERLNSWMLVGMLLVIVSVIAVWRLDGSGLALNGKADRR